MNLQKEQQILRVLQEYSGDRIIVADKKSSKGFKPLEVGNSSALAKVQYNEDKKILRVQFRNNDSIYEYAKVDPKLIVVDEDGKSKNNFESAKSKGSFFNKNIKKKHVFRQVASVINRNIKIASQLSRVNYVGRMLAKQGMLEAYQENA